jgi:hypothetical protein
MSGAKSRLSKLAAHFLPSSSAPSSAQYEHRYHIHSLSPTFFLPRAAAIEPNVSYKLSQVVSERLQKLKFYSSQAEAIYHVTANGKVLRRSYIEHADRARGFAYYVRKHGYKKVGILCTNTPAFLESIYGIAGAGAVQCGL